MNKLFKCLSTAFLGVALAVGVGVGVAQGNKSGEVSAAADYTVVFKDSGNTSDGSATKTETADIISSGSDRMTVSSASYIYQAKKGYGIKGGSSKNKGGITLTTTSTGKLKPKKIEVRAAYYSDAQDIQYSINGGDLTALGVSSTDLKNYNISMDGETDLTTIRFCSSATKGRFYLVSVAVYTTLSSTYSVIYNGNGSTGGDVPTDTKEYNSGDEVTVLGNTGSLVRTGYSFNCWNTKQDGTGENYSADDKFNISDTTTLYAKWTAEAATISFSANGADSGTAPTDVVTSYDANIDLPEKGDLVRAGYSFGGWNTSADGTGSNYLEGASYKVKGSATLYAKWDELGATFTLVTDASKLYVGDVIAIVADSTDATRNALSTKQNSSNRGVTQVSVSSGSFTSTSSVQNIVLGKSDNGHWTFYVTGNVTGYLYAASSSSNELKTQGTNNANGEWTISISNNVATIKAQGSNSRNTLKYNSSSSIFSCYSTGQNAVSIYKKVTTHGTYAEGFLDSGLCNGGVTQPSTSTWTSLKTSYEALSASDQALFTNATANEQGTSVQQCVARYDYILAKYGTTDYANFMNRTVTPASSASILSVMGTDNSVVVIVVISLVSLTAVGGYFFIRRRKETH